MEQSPWHWINQGDEHIGYLRIPGSGGTGPQGSCTLGEGEWRGWFSSYINIQCQEFRPLASSKLKLIIYLFIYLFIYFRYFTYLRDRGRESKCVGEADRERISSRLPTECRAQHGARSHDPEITTWAKTKSQTLNQLRYPGGPEMVISYVFQPWFTSAMTSFWHILLLFWKTHPLYLLHPSTLAQTSHPVTQHN